jgi:hypothetical protein
MKRSENVGLVMMGGAAFAATFAVGMAYYAWQKPANAAQPQAAAAAQKCTTRPDGTQSCEPARRGFSYSLFPTWGSSGSTTTSDPRRTSSAALTSSPRASTPAASPSGTTRGGFGTTAQSTSFRPSAGG